MSYTPPTGNAVAFSWDGAASYTAPAGGAVAFDWAAAEPPPATNDLTFSPSAPYTHPAQTAANFVFPADVNRLLDATSLAPGTLFGSASSVVGLPIYEPVITDALTFEPSDPYSLPAQTVANFIFDVPKTGTATGFLVANFGTANATINQTETAEGFTSTAFGTPAYGVLTEATGFTSTALGEDVRLASLADATALEPGSLFGTPHIHYNAVGFSPTVFGAPSSPQDVAVDATGFTTTAFGTPAQVQIALASSFGPLAIMSQAYTAQDQTAVADGFTRTRFGDVVGFRPFAPMVNQTTQAQGWLSGALGAPSSPVNTLGYAAPLVPIDAFGLPSAILAYSFTLYGTPKARITQASETVGMGTAMGEPSAVTGGMAQAIMFTAFGQPSVAAGRLASPVPRRAMFGTPKAAKTGDHRAYGLNCGRRFGRPQAFSRINYPAQGLPPTVMFGTIQALQVHRARHMAPASQFGDPLLLRTPTC